ncbi:hypothetical protein PVAND_013666 [Polypedilum vanderplanki]|uniref:ARID domain-containing protein n=1 Tax=Polypedilum vanderplanki TaxID=319348 RepID=A0A9J6CR66_POLVA|nr:hypothetical protein PVAND_013666 [Polypedilum vanderplanki]
MQGIPQKDKDDPVVLSVGAQVSAKYKGAFCEAKVHKVVKNIKVKVAFKKGGTATVTDDEIIGEIRVGNIVEINDADKKETNEATITKIQDCSQYTVVFDDGDIATLRRTALCRQSGKHFNACDTLDQLPLTHPEHRGGGKRTKTQDEYESDDEEYAIGKVVCVENNDTKKKNVKESYFPALVVAPKAQENVKIHIKTEYLVRSFKDGRYYTVPKKEVTEFTNDTASKSDSTAVAAAREFLDKNVLPPHWDREVLIDSASLSDQELSDSSDDEPNEVKDRFFAQLLEFMEKRNSPLNKGPSITNRDVDLYRLYYSVEKLGGYANVTKIRNWKAIAKRLGFTPTDAIVKLVKHSYRKFLLAFEEAVSKGIEDLPPRANRDKARSSSTRSGSVASPKVVESAKKKVEKPTTSSVADDSENTSESIKVTTSRKLSTASTKSKVDKVEEKAKSEKLEKEKPEKNKDNVKCGEKDSDKIDKEKSVSKDDEVNTIASSPTQSVTTASAKKEKTKKKPPENKKKKEDTAEKKETITIAAKIQVPSGPSIADDVIIEIDDRLKVYYRGSSDYEAKVLKISEQEGKPVYKVHYKGWNARYDEWIHRESIAENLTKDEAKKKQSSNNSNSSSTTVKTSSTSSTNLQTPTTKNPTKRARNRADTTASSRSTTPLSNTSSKTKIAQKRPTRGTPTSKSSNRGSTIDDNSSESDEPIKKPSEKKEKLNDDKIQKSSSVVDVTSSDNKDVSKTELKVIKEIKSSEKVQAPDTTKSDDEKSTKSSIKSGKSPFDVKGSKNKNIQRDSSRSSFHSTDSDSSHSVPSDVPNSSKSAYTSENESNEPEKIPASTTSTIVTTTVKTDVKKSSFRFDEETSDIKNPLSFFEKAVSEKTEIKTESGAIFPTRKSNIFQDKKATQKAAAADTSKLGRFGQSLAKEIGKVKNKDIKNEDKTAESDIYEFKDTEEFSDAKVVNTPVKKQESPNEPTKKQQLAQQRKQARQSVIDTSSTSSPMEDIESMIKTSIVSFPNKKQKKSPVKEEKAQHSMIMARTPASTSQNVIIPQPWSAIQSTAQISQELFPKTNIPPPILSQSLVSKPKSDSTFDVLRKSPSFNMHHSDDFLPSKPSTQTTPRNIAAGPVKFSSDLIEQHDLLKPIMVPSKEDEKPELEAFKKILEPSFEILPKTEVKASIADRLLKAINQKDAANEREISQYSAIIKDEPYVKIEELKMDQYTFKAKSPGTSKSTTITNTLVTTTKKPLLLSPETKIDDKAKGNVELQGIIEKLESAISTPISLTAATSLDTPTSTSFPSTKKQNDDSDTDSDRLVIEDEATPNETAVDKKKAPIGALESIMLQDDVPYKHNNPSSKEAEKKSDSGEQQSETMSLLLCEETIPGSPAPSTCKDPLSEIGRSPTSGFVHPSMPQSGSGYTMKYTGPTLLHHQSTSHQGNIKSSISMDIDSEVGIEAATGDILRDKLKSERGSATSSGNNTNNNSDNSLDDDQSESEKNVKSDISRKKKRTMKIEPDIHAKRRRQHTRPQTNVRGNLQGNDSDSNDNSDVNIFTRNQVEPSQGSSNKIQFNFLVELDPNMPSCHRISLLEKKIQDLRKTYMMIKNEMNAKERRRKKMRKRERENKQKQTAKVS